MDIVGDVFGLVGFDFDDYNGGYIWVCVGVDYGVEM